MTIITAVELVEELCLKGYELKSIICDIAVNIFYNILAIKKITKWDIKRGREEERKIKIYFNRIGRRLRREVGKWDFLCRCKVLPCTLANTAHVLNSSLYKTQDSGPCNKPSRLRLGN